jgi:hypothetical protein
MTTLEMIEKDGFFHAASTALPIVKMKNVNEFERKVTKRKTKSDERRRRRMNKVFPIPEWGKACQRSGKLPIFLE